MIVVVEGPDNAGKTTLATRLAKEINAIYVKREAHPESDAEVLAYHDLLRQASLQGNVVADRHPAFSEVVYGTVLRGTPRISPKTLQYCLTSIDALVYCRPSDDVIRGNLGDRRQMKGVNEHLDELLEAYDHIMMDVAAQHIDNYVKYNYAGNGGVEYITHFLVACGLIPEGVISHAA